MDINLFRAIVELKKLKNLNLEHLDYRSITPPKYLALLIDRFPKLIRYVDNIPQRTHVEDIEEDSEEEANIQTTTGRNDFMEETDLGNDDQF